MATRPITSPLGRRAPLAASAVLVLAIAMAASPAFAGQAPSTAVGAAQSQGTPVIKPPGTVTPKPKAPSCGVSKTKKRCSAAGRRCKTTRGVTTCTATLLRCRLSGKLKLCTVTTMRCTSSKTRKRTCRRISVKHTVNRANTARASIAIPRLRLRGGPAASSARAGAGRAVERSGAPVLPALRTGRASSGSPLREPGAAIGVLIVVLALTVAVLGPRRRRRT